MKKIQTKMKAQEWPQGYYIDFSDVQVQITPYSMVERGRNWNSFKRLCMSLLPEEMKKIQLIIKAQEWPQCFSHCKSMGKYSRCSRAANSAVYCLIWPKFKLCRDFMVVLVTCKNEDLINQRINGPVNAHLISEPSISINHTKSNRKAMNRNWSNQKANPALKTKVGNK